MQASGATTNSKGGAMAASILLSAIVVCPGQRLLVHHSTRFVDDEPGCQGGSARRTHNSTPGCNLTRSFKNVVSTSAPTLTSTVPTGAIPLTIQASVSRFGGS